jgi:proteasome beta subunit
VTVAIGLVCKDGVIVASDSMATTAQQTAVETVKVQAFSNNPVIWTSSGSVYVKEEVEAEIRLKLDDQAHDMFTEPQTLLLRKKLREVVHSAVRKCYTSALSTAPWPAGQIAASFITDFMFLGYANGTPWFLEIDMQGQVNWHTKPRFYAIGSGGTFASVCHALMKHYIVDDLLLEHGKQLAYRAIETTCDVSSGGVGPPVQIAVVDEHGPSVLTQDEVRKIEAAVARWKELEADPIGMGTDSLNGELEDLPTLEVNESE